MNEHDILGLVLSAVVAEYVILRIVRLTNGGGLRCLALYPWELLLGWLLFTIESAFDAIQEPGLVNWAMVCVPALLTTRYILMIARLHSNREKGTGNASVHVENE